MNGKVSLHITGICLTVVWQGEHLNWWFGCLESQNVSLQSAACQVHTEHGAANFEPFLLLFFINRGHGRSRIGGRLNSGVFKTGNERNDLIPSLPFIAHLKTAREELAGHGGLSYLSPFSTIMKKFGKKEKDELLTLTNYVFVASSSRFLCASCQKIIQQKITFTIIQLKFVQ